MAENHSVLSAARAWKGEKLAIATVVSTWGSAPRSGTVKRICVDNGQPVEYGEALVVIG